MVKFYKALCDDLETFVRVLAWLNSTPENEKISRRESLENEGFALDMPECEAFYIIGYLMEIGISMSDRAITFGELESWQSTTGIRLESWEARIMKRLSDMYLSESHSMRDPQSVCPWVDAPGYMSPAYRNAMRVKNALKKAAEI